MKVSNRNDAQYSSRKELEAHIISTHSAAAWKMWRENYSPELTRRFQELGGWEAIDAGASDSTFWWREASAGYPRSGGKAGNSEEVD